MAALTTAPQSWQSTFMTAPTNLWDAAGIKSPIQVGGRTYNALNGSQFFSSIYGKILMQQGKLFKAAGVVEGMIAPNGLTQLKNYIQVMQEAEPLRPTVETVGTCTSYSLTQTADNERIAQGNVLSNTASVARDLIRSTFPTLITNTAVTTLQEQRNKVPNPLNNAIYCILGLPADYEEQVYGQIWVNPSVTVLQTVSDPRSSNAGDFVITDAISDATNSPTSLCSAADSALASDNAYIGDTVFDKKPATYEALMYVGDIPRDAFDIAANRKRSVFQRFTQYARVINSNGLPELRTQASNPVSSIGGFINAGWGTDANTPSTATRTTQVTAEVLLPTIPVGTQLIRMQASDGEDSGAKPSFYRDPVPFDYYCQITRYGLATATDTAIVQSYINSMVVQGSPELRDAFTARAAVGGVFSDKMSLFNTVNGAGLGTSSTDVDRESLIDLSVDALILPQFQSMKLMVEEKGSQYLYGAGRFTNPISSYIYNTATNFNAVAMVRQNISKGINANGLEFGGGSAVNKMYNNTSQGLLSSIPNNNVRNLPVGNFDISAFADIAGDIIANGGADEYLWITDYTGANDIDRTFRTAGSSFRYAPSTNVNGGALDFMSLTIKDIEIAGIRGKLIVLPDLAFLPAAEKGTFYLINPGTPEMPLVIPYFVNSPVSVKSGEQANDRTIKSWGLITETGLATRGFVNNAWVLKRK